MKKSKQKNVISRLFVDMGKYKSSFRAVFGVIVVIKLCLAAAPKVVSIITDTMQEFVNSGNYDFGKLLIQCALLAVLYLIGYGADGFINRSLVLISQNLSLNLRNKAGHKLNRLTIHYSDNHPLGDTQSRVTSDMLNLSNGIESTLPSLLGQAVLMAAIAIMMLFTNIWLALIYIIAMPVTFIGLRMIAKRTNTLYIGLYATFQRLDGKNIVYSPLLDRRIFNDKRNAYFGRIYRIFILRKYDRRTHFGIICCFQQFSGCVKLRFTHI